MKKPMVSPHAAARINTRAEYERVNKMDQVEKHSRLGNAQNEIKLNEVYTGFISNVMPYGVFVQFGRSSGLCHNSCIPSTVDRAGLLKGRKVKVTVLEIRPGKKLSLALLEILPVEATGKTPYKKPHRQTNGVLVADNLKYSQDIGSAVGRGSDEINKVGLQYRNNTAPTRTGYVAEPDHTATFNVDAAFKRSKVRATRLGSLDAKSPDIVLHDEAGVVVKEVSSKICQTAEETAKAQRGYGNQDRLSPQDQSADIKSFASRRAAAERYKSEPHRQRVATEYDEVAGRTTDHVSNGNVKSMPRTRAQSREMADKAREGSVTGNDIVGDVGERMQQGASQGGKSGAKIGAAAAAITGTYQAVKDVRSGKKTVVDASFDVVIEVGKGAADGAAKGIASGAATAAARVLAERTASQGLKRVLGGSAPAAVAISAVEIAKHAIDFARGVKTADEFHQAAKSSVKSGATSFIGAEIGFAIGGPVGALIGGIAGPMIADKAEEVGLGVRLNRLFSSNTATGHNGATAFHLSQLKGLLTALQDSSAVIFPDRVLQIDTGHHVAAEIVMVHQGKVYAVDFKAWKGSLMFPEIMQTKTITEKVLWWESTKEVQSGTGKYDTQHVNQLKIDQYDISHSTLHRNPLRNLGSFVHHIKNRLVTVDPRWKHVRIETLVVFPDDSVEFAGDMASDGRFMVLSNFLKLFAEGEGKATPKWMLDGLSLTPTWDVLQDPAGNIYQGIIQTDHFTMQMKDGVVDIPFDAVLKVEVAHGGGMSRSDKVTVTLHDRNTLEGTVEKQEIILRRKGHSHPYLLRDLSLVCPAYRYFQLDFCSLNRSSFLAN